jgi:hypothetical protein
MHLVRQSTLVRGPTDLQFLKGVTQVPIANMPFLKKWGLSQTVLKTFFVLQLPGHESARHDAVLIGS